MAHQTGFKRDDHDSNAVIKQYGIEEIPTDEHPTANLREYITGDVYDQGQLRSCSAAAVCAAYELVLRRGAILSDLSPSDFKCSRLFVYYNTRDIQNNTEGDTGASLGNAFKAIQKYGVCSQSLWSDKEKISDKPTVANYASAKHNKIINYQRLGPHIQQFRACLKDGFPFTFGFKVYNSFRSLENDKTGMMPLPSKEEVESDPEPDMQAALAVGYNDETKCITVLNSWGKSFGDKGYFYMPYEYISNSDLAFDFWTIIEVSERFPIWTPDDTLRHTILMRFFTRIS